MYHGVITAHFDHISFLIWQYLGPLDGNTAIVPKNLQTPKKTPLLEVRDGQKTERGIYVRLSFENLTATRVRALFFCSELFEI